MLRLGDGPWHRLRVTDTWRDNLDSAGSGFSTQRLSSNANSNEAVNHCVATQSVVSVSRESRCERLVQEQMTALFREPYVRKSAVSAVK
jgi:hypothetical protein